MGYNFGKAMLTNKGIFIREQYFTCEKAIREQWFKRSNNQGKQLFEAFYEKNNFEKILIRYGDELLICTLIERINKPQNEEYFRKLQQLKAEIYEIKGKKSKMKKGER